VLAGIAIDVGPGMTLFAEERAETYLFPLQETAGSPSSPVPSLAFRQMVGLGKLVRREGVVATAEGGGPRRRDRTHKTRRARLRGAEPDRRLVPKSVQDFVAVVLISTRFRLRFGEAR
jgi:hypothetical protein